MKLDELEKLAKETKSQSWVRIEIYDMLKLIEVAKLAKELNTAYGDDHFDCAYKIYKAVKELEK